MSFAEKAAQDCEALILDHGEISEGVEYQNFTASGAQPWKPLTVVIDDGQAQDPTLRGPIGRRGPQPVEVFVLKDSVNGVAEPRKGFDKVKRFPGTNREQLFTVAELLEASDPGWWRFYAVP